MNAEMINEYETNNMKQVALSKAYLLLNHGPVTLISAADEDRKNVMAASWAMPLDFSPPKVAVVIDKDTYTRPLIEASGNFAINIPCRAFADTVLAVGTQSGHDVDKFSSLAIASTPAEKIGAPLIVGCVAWLECVLIPEPHNQLRYDLFLGEVVTAWADPRVFVNGRWDFSDEQLRTIHYSAGGTFFATGSPFHLSAEDPET